MKKSIIIVNIVMAGGGDYALGKKIKDIARSTQADGVLFTVSVKSKKFKSESEERFNPCKAVNYNHPVIIVSPYSIMPPRALSSILADLFYQLDIVFCDTVILIDEMDITRDYGSSDRDYEVALSNLGLKNIIFHSLGFSKKSLGYLPMPDQEVIKIQKSAKRDVINLLDSYNLSLPESCGLYIAYLSSETVTMGSQIFIINTLIEEMGSQNNSAYVLVCREVNNIQRVLNHLKSIFSKPPYNDLFSECYISSMKDENTITSHGYTRGTGNKKIHIVITATLPSTIFQSLTSISKTGMMSGDQSLSDYLSLKQRLPYYDKQIWKEPLIDGLKERASELGGEELLNKFQSMVAGRTAYVCTLAFKILTPDDVPTPALNKSLLAFNREVYARKADRKIREILIKYL
ncbi:hypothetical protein L2090_20045 [Rahnella victoriana]|nr:hypothetical protein [Rahnella victoriana]